MKETSCEIFEADGTKIEKKTSWRIIQGQAVSEKLDYIFLARVYL